MAISVRYFRSSPVTKSDPIDVGINCLRTEIANRKYGYCSHFGHSFAIATTFTTCFATVNPKKTAEWRKWCRKCGWIAGMRFSLCVWLFGRGRKKMVFTLFKSRSHLWRASFATWKNRDAEREGLSRVNPRKNFCHRVSGRIAMHLRHAQSGRGFYLLKAKVECGERRAQRDGWGASPTSPDRSLPSLCPACPTPRHPARHTLPSAQAAPTKHTQAPRCEELPKG